MVLKLTSFKKATGLHFLKVRPSYKWIVSLNYIYLEFLSIQTSVWICINGSYAIFKDSHTCKKWILYKMLLAFLFGADFSSYFGSTKKIHLSSHLYSVVNFFRLRSIDGMIVLATVFRCNQDQIGVKKLGSC